MIRIGDEVILVEDLVKQPCVFYYNWASKTIRLHSASCYHYTKRATKKLGEHGGWSKVYDSYEEAFKASLLRENKDRIFHCKDCWKSR